MYTSSLPPVLEDDPRFSPSPPREWSRHPTLEGAAMTLAQEALRLNLSPVDFVLMAIYFAFVLGIGFALRRAVRSSLDFFLSGRSLPAWITGIGFLSANIGAVELLGQSASGAQYGSAMVHYFWVGAIPAMVFLGIVMMPFYYGSKVRSVPEYLRLRFDPKAHLINAITFVLGSMLIAGVNLYALAIVLEALLGIPLILAIVLSALFVLSYILLGGLTSAIYNEVMQFFVIMIGMIPLTIIAIKETGGLGSLFDKLRDQHGESFVHPWVGTGIGGSNPVGDWIGIILGLAFCLSFGYWTTNFAEVQRAMAAKDGHSARLTPIIGAYPKAFVPLITVLPGMAALILIPGIGPAGSDVEYNQAIPALMDKYLPQGALGVAVTGLLAAFMAGMAANVSSFNAVFTYDIWQDYIRPGRPDRYYLVVGRWVTVAGVAIAILTALIASGFANISNYLQTLFSFFNVPLFCAFIIGMFWKRATRSAGFWGILVGTVVAVLVYFLYRGGVLDFRSDLHETMWGSIAAFAAGAIAMVLASMREQPKTDAELHGLVYGMEIRDASETMRYPWYRSPVVLGIGVLVICLILYIIVSVL
jgi:solute:Na+ symporter, SSS family